MLQQTEIPRNIVAQNKETSWESSRMSEHPFDDRDGVIWFNGRFVPWRDARLHVLSHALHYASCVFEGERAYDGKIFELTQHTKRLHKSAETLGFELPYSVQEIDDACRATLAKADLKDAYIRPVAWRGSEQMGVSAQSTRINVAIAVWEWPAYFTPEARMKGIRLTWGKYRRPDPMTAQSMPRRRACT